MIGLVNLSDNSETQVSSKDFLNAPLANVWIDVTDPSREELEIIAGRTSIPTDFLQLPESENFVNLRIEPEYGVINFLMVEEIFASKIFRPIVLAFSKDVLVTVVGKEGQSKFRIVKERMHKVKIDPPSLVAYFILDEIVDSHFMHLEKIEENTVNLEEEVLEKTGEDTLKNIFSLKARLVSFNKVL
jgi:Mg2+ and Co2+ transporter CorA